MVGVRRRRVGRSGTARHGAPREHAEREGRGSNAGDQGTETLVHDRNVVHDRGWSKGARTQKPFDTRECFSALLRLLLVRR